MTKKTVKKKVTKKKSNDTSKTKVEEPSLKIVSTSKCKTISGQSTVAITYQRGAAKKYFTDC